MPLGSKEEDGKDQEHSVSSRPRIFVGVLLHFVETFDLELTCYFKRVVMERVLDRIRKSGSAGHKLCGHGQVN